MARNIGSLTAAALAVLIALGLGQGAGRAADLVVELKFSDFYTDELLNEFSAKIKGHAGEVVIVRGYMAPPLKANGKFVVLTREPVELCPYCATDEEWPRDTIVAYMRVTKFDLENKIKIGGKLELGSKKDAGTGFVSLIRLMDATIVP